MNHGDIASLMKGMAPVIRDLIAAAVQPLVDENAGLKRQVEDLRAGVAAMVNEGVAGAVAALPVPAPGSDADPEIIRQMVTEAVAAIPAPAPGKDADPAVVAEMVSRQVADAVAALPKAIDGKDADPALIAEMVATEMAKIPPAPAGKDADPDLMRSLIDEAVTRIPAPANGKDAEPELVERLVTETVDRVLAGWDKPKDGTSVTLEDVAPMIERSIAERVALIPVPKDGAPGKMPIAKAYEDRVYYEGEVATFDGSTYQAQRDTGRAPPHDDWTCIAAAGAPGRDAKPFRIRGTYVADGEYEALDVVTLNGGSFVAKKDNPGACPGEGWQLQASQGKRGQPGEAIKGDPGRSIKGDAGPPVVAAAIDDQGMLTLVNGDGSTVECDLYPVLSNLGAHS